MIEYGHQDFLGYLSVQHSTSMGIVQTWHAQYIVAILSSFKIGLNPVHPTRPNLQVKIINNLFLQLCRVKFDSTILDWNICNISSWRLVHL